MLTFNVLLNVLLGISWLILVYRDNQCRRKEKLLSEQEQFLGTLSDQYARCGDLHEALEESMQMGSSQLRHEVELLSDTFAQEGLWAHSYDGRQAENSYFLLLYSLCDTIRTFGDQQLHGVSLFIHNLRYIREEVRIELLRRQEAHYAFLGLKALSILPFFICIPIRVWNRSISDSLERFYVGSYGFVTLTVCFFLSVCCGFGVQQLQEPTMLHVDKNPLIQRLFRISFFEAAVDRHIAAHYSRYLKKNEQLKELQGYGNIREFLVKKLLDAVFAAGATGVWLLGCRIAGTAAEHLPLRSVFAGIGLMFVAGSIGFWVPDAKVVILQVRTEYQKMEETLRFETLVLLVMHHSEVTVEELLRWMEQFSDIFSRALQRAVDDYSYQRKESLLQLREDLSYEPAKKLVDALLACDDLPVSQAFYDVEGERAYNLEQLKQKAWDMQREKAALARLIAFLPFVAVLVLRLIVPFVLEGLTQLQGYA